MEFRVDSKRIAKFFLVIIITLTALHILGKIFIYLGYPSVFGFVQLFDLDGEGNVPTYYSALSILFCSLLFGIIYFIKRKKNLPYAYHWLGLSLVFLFLSIDESSEIHELITGLIHLKYQTSGIFYSAWIIPYGIFLILFVAAYFKFWMNLPSRTRLWFFIAGLAYAVGAVGFEILGETLEQRHLMKSGSFILCVTIEEFLEMMGILALIHALLSYIRSELADSGLHLKFT